MAQFPQKEDIDTRQDKASERLAEVKKAYTEFVKKMERLEKEESELIAELGTHIDKTKLYSVLSKIDNIK